MLLILKYQVLVDQLLKHSMTQTNMVLKKKIEDIGKKIPNTSGPVKKAGYNTKITEMENKISSVTGLVTTTMLNTKTTGIVNRIPDITIVATKAALN